MSGFEWKVYCIFCVYLCLVCDCVFAYVCVYLFLLMCVCVCFVFVHIRVCACFGMYVCICVSVRTHTDGMRADCKLSRITNPFHIIFGRGGRDVWNGDRISFRLQVSSMRKQKKTRRRGRREEGENNGLKSKTTVSVVTSPADEFMRATQTVVVVQLRLLFLKAKDAIPDCFRAKGGKAANC